MDANPDFLQTGMPGFPDHPQIGERVVQLTFHHGLDLIDRHPPPAAQGLKPVHQIGPDGTQYIFEGRHAFVGSIEVHRCADTELMLPGEDGRLAALASADTQGPGVALHRCLLLTRAHLSRLGYIRAKQAEHASHPFSGIVVGDLVNAAANGGPCASVDRADPSTNLMYTGLKKLSEAALDDC